MKIGIDVDGVLRNIAGKIIELYNSEYNANIQYNEIKDYKMEDIVGMNTDEFMMKYFFELGHEVFEKSNVIGNPTESLINLKNNGHDIHIITHQFKGLEAYTIRWLINNEIPYDSITFSEDKSIVNVDLFVDDKVENLQRVQFFGNAISLCFDQPWNKNFNGKRISNLDEIFPFIECEMLEYF